MAVAGRILPKKSQILFAITCSTRVLVFRSLARTYPKIHLQVLQSGSFRSVVAPVWKKERRVAMCGSTSTTNGLQAPPAKIHIQFNGVVPLYNNVHNVVSEIQVKLCL
eukprot:scpid88088/ scgid32160/ 